MLLSLGFSYHSQLSWTSKVFPGTNPVHEEGLETRLYRLTFSINLPTAVFHLSIVFTFFLMTLEKACHSKWNVGPPNANKVLSQTPPTVNKSTHTAAPKIWRQFLKPLAAWDTSFGPGRFTSRSQSPPWKHCRSTPRRRTKASTHRTANSGWSSR